MQYCVLWTLNIGIFIQCLYDTFSGFLLWFLRIESKVFWCKTQNTADVRRAIFIFPEANNITKLQDYRFFTILKEIRWSYAGLLLTGYLTFTTYLSTKLLYFAKFKSLICHVLFKVWLFAQVMRFIFIKVRTVWLNILLKT